MCGNSAVLKSTSGYTVNWCIRVNWSICSASDKVVTF